MSLNIKNDRVHALAREAARRSGKSQTGAIEEALERYLAQLPEGPPLADIEWILRDVDARLDAAARKTIRDALVELHDERTGLPA